MKLQDSHGKFPILLPREECPELLYSMAGD